jgi:hypothetical protein
MIGWLGRYYCYFLTGELLMRSHIYVLTFVLSFVLFQAGCCVLPTYITSDQARNDGLALIARQVNYDAEAGETVHIGAGLELYTAVNTDLNEVISLNVQLTNETQYRGVLFVREGDTITQESPSILRFKGTLTEIRTLLSNVYYIVPDSVGETYSQTITIGFLRESPARLGNSVKQYVRTEPESLLVEAIEPAQPVPTRAQSNTNTPSGTTPTVQNVAPANIVPGTQGVTHRQPHVMNFMVSDPDIANNPLTVAIQVGKGTLTVIPVGGVTVTGNGTGALTITGTLENVNNTLLGADGVGVSAGVVYHYTGDHLAEGASTTDSLNFISRDNHGAEAVSVVELQVSNPFVAPIETATPMPTHTPTATFTAMPTNMPTATFTAMPTNMPTATFTPMPTNTPAGVCPTSGLAVATPDLYLSMSITDDFEGDLSQGIIDPDVEHPVSYSLAFGLPAGFHLDGQFIRADQAAVYAHSADITGQVHVTDARNCSGTFELLIQND